MRLLTSLVLCLLLSAPAWGAFNGPSATSAPLVTAGTAASAMEGATCVLEGNITEHLVKDRYSFKDSSGTIIVNIPPHVFGSQEVTPANTVKITGEIRGKKDLNRQDPHIGVRYLEVLK